MAFETGIAAISEYLEHRAECIKEGKPIDWADDFEELKPKFNRDEERGKYSKLKSSVKQAKTNRIIPLRVRLAWLCACERDLHIQFAKADGKLKTPLDTYRHTTSRFNYLAKNTLKHVIEYTKEPPE